MNKTQRTVRDMIQRGGGRDVAIRPGGKHQFVEFTAPDGTAHSLPLHNGTNPKRYEDCLRSQLRRAGLRP